MNKETYFKTIRNLSKELKERFGFDYIRVFSEPRKSTGYRSKYWGVGRNSQSTIDSVINHINETTPFTAVYVKPTDSWGLPGIKVFPFWKSITE